jgi:hypothetical protein
VLTQKLEELKRTQEEELEGQLDAGVKRILAANRRMAEEMRLHITVRVHAVQASRGQQCC